MNSPLLCRIVSVAPLLSKLTAATSPPALPLWVANSTCLPTSEDAWNTELISEMFSRWIPFCRACSMDENWAS